MPILGLLFQELITRQSIWICLPLGVAVVLLQGAQLRPLAAFLKQLLSSVRRTRDIMEPSGSKLSKEAVPEEVPLPQPSGKELSQSNMRGHTEPSKNPLEQDQRVEEPASPWAVKASGECLKKNTIRKLFSDGKLGEALKQFKECALPEFQNLGTMLQAHFSLIETHKIEGIISDRVYRLEWLKIGKALLQLLDYPDVFSK